MSTIDTTISNAPYYDNYDALKNYTKILALGGRIPQARDFTQAQTMTLDFIKRLSDSLMRDGDMIEGCDLTIIGTTATLSAGKIYMNGIIRNLPQTSVTITAVGNETIGVMLVQDIKTEANDVSFYEPTQGATIPDMAGCHRLHEYLQVVVDDITSSATLYNLENGIQNLLIDKPQIDTMLDLLASRMYDEAGNYKISGLTLFDKHILDAQTVTICIDMGICYIKGYKIQKPTAMSFTIPKALTTRIILNEPKSYLATNLPNRYKLNNSPVKDITSITMEVQVTQTMTRGGIVNGMDDFTLTPLVEITAITQGATIFLTGIDFQMSGESIDWSLSGAEPAGGTTYTATWIYQKEAVDDVDYSLVTDITGDYLNFNMLGDKPVNYSMVYANYEAYVGRKDLVCIDMNGDAQVISGQPDSSANIVAPINNDDSLMKLGTVYLPPDSDSTIIVDCAVTRMSMENINNLLLRIQDVEYNSAISDLDNQAITSESALELNGVLTDGFIGLSKADVYHADYDCAMDFDNKWVQPSYSDNVLPLVINNGLSSNINMFRSLITASFTEIVGLSQLTATETQLVNPYSVFNRYALLVLTPSMDSWINETDITTSDGTNITSHNITKWWMHGGASWAAGEQAQFAVLANAATIAKDIGTNFNLTAVQGYDTSTTQVLDTATMYMRQIPISVTGRNFIPFSDNIACTFDGVSVPLTTTAHYKGTAPNTAKADATGNVVAGFTIPAGIRTGSRIVSFTNSQNSGATTFIAEGRDRTVDTIVTHQVLLLTPIDPIAQSFMFTSTSIVTSIGLYFSAKDPIISAVIQIRGMENGYPNAQVYGEKVVYPSGIAISANSSAETKITFDDPIICNANTQYCIVILSDSNLYQMFVSNLGDLDLLTPSYVSKQPYIAGVLFNSSNALTWSAFQAKDLKFKIYIAQFSNSSVLQFNAITGIDISRLLLTADYLTPIGSFCSWSYQMNSNVWMPIQEYSDIPLPSLATTVNLKGVFTSTDPNVSVILQSQSLNSVGFLGKTSFVYMTKNTFSTEGFNTVKQVIDVFLPSGTTLTVKFATDTLGTVWTTQTSPSVTILDVTGNLYRYTFNTTLRIVANNYRARVEMTTTQPTIVPYAQNFINIMKTL